ncbi:MAG: alkaline phosphatase family protein, partial [Candidatus Baldrarchaeia archaeon]
MTIIVLGFDGLEFYLVEKYKLKHLQQKAYTKLSLEDFDVIVTPPIWASMITGVVFKDMVKKFNPAFHSSKGFLAQIKNVLPWRVRRLLGRALRPVQRIIEGYENPMDVTLDYLSRRKIPTIFDEFGRVWYTAIPGYNMEAHTIKLKKEAFEDDKAKKHVVRNRDELFKRETENLFATLSHKIEYDLIFWYTGWLDATGHLEQGSKLKIMNRYLKINLLVAQLKKQLDDNDILYIISDHGMMPLGRLGYHSDHGFFSSSNGE